ncbi:ATP-dependent helicase [Sporosarcina sp. Marseille-Q4063]|uniref:ATP-dependent helicase n=1 Tax=Sporosarcina sp. Marseille-Q4063 TaxID=2810514 RepID=UPI001BAF24B5|nr:ATP-dependent helicase [Sporosarcina sp. Marseille-Q4063]QUW23200.1 ATP-dependent helicase [Sporosarcina sp. Marseille-Q4063]
MTDFFERKKIELGIELNDIQKKAVLQTEGPTLLLACPGSGKTTTIIMRIGYLIEEKNVDPRRIKAITFSRASAADMTERFARFFPQSKRVDFSTIHSLALQITRTYLDKRKVTYELIEGNRESRTVNKLFLLKNIYKEVLKEECTDDQFSSLSTYISSLKNRMIPMDKWAELKGPVEKAGVIAQKYEAFKSKQPGQLFLDFDDMLVVAEEALRLDDELAAKFRNKYDYVLTDESQDTSLVQHQIVEHLVAHHGNLCVVADDDQSIYTWRGADPDYLLEFKKVYPDAQVLMMERNYRSTKEIVETSAKFIKRNKNRYPKEMHTENPSARPISVKQLDDPKRQLEYVTYELLGEKDLSDVAILFRNNSSSTMFVSELHRRGIPFYMKDADDRFFAHWIVEDILNFMRLSFNTDRKDIFSKIILKMNLYVSRSMVTKFENSKTTGNVFDAFIRSVDLRNNQIKKLEDYKKGYQVIPEMRPMRVIQLIRNDLGYEAALKSRAEKFGFRFDSLLSILDTLEGIAAPLRTMVDFANQLKELETAVQNAKFNPPENAVTLSTFHSSKGLEFRRVFMIDLVKGIIPSEDDEGSDATMEEARRLFYVGMTRAKERLELLTYREDNGKSEEDSRFLYEVRRLLLKPKELTDDTTSVQVSNKINVKVPVNPNGIQTSKELAVGMRVKHRVFGFGEINDLKDQEISIQFKKMERRFDLETILSLGLLEKVAL